MAAILQCPQCGTRLKVQESGAGKRVRCPKCQTVLAAAAPEPVGNLQGFLDEDAEEPVAPLRAPTRFSAREKPSRPSWLLPAVIGGGMAVCLLVVVGVVLLGRGPKVGSVDRNAPGANSPGASASSGDTGRGGTLPAWSPDPALLDQLTPEAALPGRPEFSMRVPKGYQNNIKVHADGFGGGYWLAPKPPSGHAVTLAVHVQPPIAPILRKPDDLERSIATWLGVQQRKGTEWKQSASEYGDVNGIRFARVRWNGLDAVEKCRVHGFAYVHLDDTAQVRISCYAAEPEHVQILALCEAAALTFRRTGPSPAPTPAHGSVKPQ